MDNLSSNAFSRSDLMQNRFANFILRSFFVFGYMLGRPAAPCVTSRMRFHLHALTTGQER